MKSLLLALFLLSPFFAKTQTNLPANTKEKPSSQATSGNDAKPANAQPEIWFPTPDTRAVVIGISNYQDEKIPDLRFADRDALAFANFLRSPAGGAVPEAQIVLLTNQKATAGNIIAALTGLVEESKLGDRAIISFSGHGDVEQVTKSQWGYLLAHDAPPKVYPAGGTVPLPYLQDIIATLSEAGVQVFVVSDACHAGKLAGSSRSGSKATTSVLAQQFSNEVKILSCQPDEFSIEGEQWGSGRGCFSFHLLNALLGAADANSDGAVSLLETGRYLEDKVPADAAPQSQIPMLVGSRNTVLAHVDAPTLAAFWETKNAPPTLSGSSMKGMEDALLSRSFGTDSSLQDIYHRFVAALESGNLFDSSGSSANDLYLRLISELQLARLHGAMTRNLAAALQNQAQVVINQLLATDPQIVDDAFSPVSKYDHLPAWLARAAELLGEKHYMYRFLKAREYFFRSKTLRVDNHPGIPADSLLHRQLACLDTALTFDSDAAYLYFEKGYLQFWGMLQSPELYSPNFEKAVALSPEWALPVYFLGRVTWEQLNDTAKGIELLNKAIEMDSTFLPAYREIGWASKGKQRNFWFEEYVRRMRGYEGQNPGRVPVTYYNYLGSSLWNLGRNEEAKAALLKGVEISKGKFPLLYSNLGVVYCDLGQYEEAEKAAMKLIEISPFNGEGYNQLAKYRHYFLKKKMETVPGLYQRAIQLGRNLPNNDLAFFYQQQGQFDSALLVSRKWLDKDTTKPQALLRLGQILSMQGNEMAAREAFQKLLLTKTGWVFYPAFYYQLTARLQSRPGDNFQAFIETERLKSDDLPGFCFWTACALAAFGRRDAALDWLEKALQAGWKPFIAISVISTLFNPDLDPIRDTRRFKKMVKKHLPEQAKIMKIK